MRKKKVENTSNRTEKDIVHSEFIFGKKEQERRNWILKKEH